jgi:hypothetical protein
LPLLPCILGVLVTTTLYHPSSRYRLPMVPALALLGGVGVTGLRDLAPRSLRLGLAGVIATVCVVLMMRTLTYRPRNPAYWEIRTSQSAVTAHDLAEAHRRNLAACAVGPKDPVVDNYMRQVVGVPNGCAGLPTYRYDH